MAFIRPTLDEIYDRAKGDLKNALGLVAILRRSFEDAVAKVIAGAAHILHGHMRFISRQIFPDQAELVYLERWASIYGIQRKAATFAVLTIAGTGTNGSVIPAGTPYQRSDGEGYTTETEVTIAAGIFSVNIIADNAGANSNIDDADEVSLTSPISGVNTAAVVSSTVTEGEDVETDASLRERVLARIRNPPSGGTANDYIAYARSVAGVTRAWVFPGHLGEGTVGVSFVEDGEDPIIPAPAKVAEVQAAVDESKPVTAEAFVFAPDEEVVPMTIALSPNTSAVQLAVTAELEDLFSREGQVAGAYRAVGQTYDGKLSISKIREAISVADGEENHELTIPTADVEPATGSIISLGTLTFTTLS